jgi:hypothetical protein
MEVQQIPNIVHFIFGLKKDFGGKPFGILQYLSVVSAAKRIKPDAIYFYYAYEPQGEWWDRVKEYVTPVRVELLTHIKTTYIKHTAHRADLLRMLILREKGGIYLDLDTIVLRSFDELRSHSMVMGKESEVEGGLGGLANAVFLTRPHSDFIEAWAKSYAYWNDDHWGGFSVELPSQMAKDHPDWITVLPQRAFFYPHWDARSLERMFLNDKRQPPLDWSQSYVVHLWETKSYEKYIKYWTVDYLRGSSCHICSEIQDLLPNDSRTLQP